MKISFSTERLNNGETLLTTSLINEGDVISAKNHIKGCYNQADWLNTISESVNYLLLGYADKIYEGK